LNRDIHPTLVAGHRTGPRAADVALLLLLATLWGCRSR